jgi:hypothetical protein
MIFLSPRGNAELVLKLHIALHASNAVITILIQHSMEPDHLPSTELSTSHHFTSSQT